jgi:hypothetical protein
MKEHKTVEEFLNDPATWGKKPPATATFTPPPPAKGEPLPKESDQ